MKVLGISDSCDLYTGFGTQTLVVLKGLLQKGIEVEQLGWFKQETIMHQGIPIHHNMEIINKPEPKILCKKYDKQ